MTPAQSAEMGQRMPCTKAAGLRHAMRKYWKLPSEENFRYSGPDWLMHLFRQCDSETRDRTLLLLWRAWHLRNDIIHNDGRATIEGSVAFLQTFTNQDPTSTSCSADRKGKGTWLPSNIGTECKAPAVVTTNWCKPPTDWIKLNTDASFQPADGSSTAGTIARDHMGNVIMGAFTTLPNCLDAEEAEARVALFGIQAATVLTCPNVILELDCFAIANALRSSSPDRSANWAVIEEAKMILKNRDFHISLIKRASNSAADSLAKKARTEGN